MLLSKQRCLQRNSSAPGPAELRGAALGVNFCGYGLESGMKVIGSDRKWDGGCPALEFGHNTCFSGYLMEMHLVPAHV